MMRRILFSNDDAKIPTVDQYDCIVVDEAHRGYTLDREMNETELEYRDQKDYIRKYRKVIEYFDAVKIGMTMQTPSSAFSKRSLRRWGFRLMTMPSKR